MHGLRPQYQDRVNFVILDYDIDDDVALAEQMTIAQHPAYGVVPPDSAPGAIARRAFGPQNEKRLRAILDEAIAKYSNAAPAN